MIKRQRNRITLALMAICGLTIGMIFSVPAKAQSPVNGTAFGGNYRTVTTASHTSNSASGSFTATHKTGAYISDPTCAVTVTALDNLGNGMLCQNASGTLSCSKTVYKANTYGSHCNSNFCGVYYWNASD